MLMHCPHGPHHVGVVLCWFQSQDNAAELIIHIDVVVSAIEWLY